jgi:preprotein translocase subunit SecE
MTVHEDLKRERARVGQKGASTDGGPDAPSRAEPAPEGELRAGDIVVQPADGPDDVGVRTAGAPSPTQLGTRRFVYAGYFAAAIGIAFLVSKVIDFAWLKLQSYEPSIAEPRDDIIMPAAALIGAGTAVYYWYRTRARELAEEVATEMSKVTWPTRTEVTNGTVVVILTTVVSTLFFALMDKFWGFITNLVYGGS